MRMLNNQLNLIPSNKIGFQSLEEVFCKESALTSDLKALEGKKVIFRTDFSKESIPLQALSSDQSSSRFPFVPREFSSNPRERTIASIDSSCVLIGETEEGAIYAGRVATVLASKGRVLKYYRAGPVIFYIDPSTMGTRLGSRAANKVLASILFDRRIAERFIRIYLERKAQIQTANSLNDSIIVVDGSLRSSLLEQGETTLKHLEEVSQENFNQLIGFSKASSLRLISNACGLLQSYQKSPAFIDLTSSIRAFLPGWSSAKITVAKFSMNCPVFRLDFSLSNAEDEAQLLSDLRYNDSFFRGYPETLRLAHHLSVFDSSTISSIRSFLSKQYGLVQVPSEDLRAMILGRLA